MNYATILVASGLTSLVASTAIAGELGALITPAELVAASTETPVILDIRAKGFTEGHIAGAVSAPYGLFRGPAENPGAVPSVDKLETTYESLGLDPARPVVIVSQGDTDTDFGAAARVYWTLKSSGFTELSVLNGGQMAWVNAGLPISTIAGTPTPTELSIVWNPTWTADTSAVTDIVEGKSEAVLVDARPAAFFEGKKAHETAARPGTLPGAENLPYTEFFRAGATAIDTQSDVSALKTRLGISADDEVISFCNTGHWAATDWFALSELAGIENVKLYPGSMVEYSKTEGAMANQPGLLDNLLNQLTGAN